MSKYNYDKYTAEFYGHLYIMKPREYIKFMEGQISEHDCEKYNKNAAGWVKHTHRVIRSSNMKLSKTLILRGVISHLKSDVDVSKIPYLDEKYLDPENMYSEFD